MNQITVTKPTQFDIGVANVNCQQLFHRNISISSQPGTGQLWQKTALSSTPVKQLIW
jgi:hypothetical protein